MVNYKTLFQEKVDDTLRCVNWGRSPIDPVEQTLGYFIGQLAKNDVYASQIKGNEVLETTK